MSFFVSHTEHDHVVLFCLAAIDLNKSSTTAGTAAVVLLEVVDVAPGFAPPQHKHFDWLKSFSAMQASHDHFDDFCLATIDLKTSSTTALVVTLAAGVLEVAVEIGDDALGFGALQHKHLVTEISFDAKQSEQFHLPCDCFAANSFRDVSDLDVVVASLDCDEEAEPNENRLLPLHEAVGVSVDFTDELNENDALDGVNIVDESTLLNLKLVEAATDDDGEAAVDE